jgi:GDP-fucose protein O-fucosyltransferase
LIELLLVTILALLLLSLISQWNKLANTRPTPKTSAEFIVGMGNQVPDTHRVAGLSCPPFHKGIPLDPSILESMIYWRDIPSDELYTSPLAQSLQELYPDLPEQYITFELDEGGFNNVRMALENVLVIAIATNRTVVLPPVQNMYRLWDLKLNSTMKQYLSQQLDQLPNSGLQQHEQQELIRSLRRQIPLQRRQFSIADFFHLASIQRELGNKFRVISMHEFLERLGRTGQLRDLKTGQVLFPPGNRTDWDGGSLRNWDAARVTANQHQPRNADGVQLWTYLRRVTRPMDFWNPQHALLAIPCNATPAAQEELHLALQQVLAQERSIPVGMDASLPQWERRARMLDKSPIPVNASMVDRLSAVLGDRHDLYFYNLDYWDYDKKAAPFSPETNGNTDSRTIDSRVIHIRGQQGTGRLLAQFYTFVFFADYRQDLWMKRFVRDHLRYIDDVFCAAARVIQALRQDAAIHYRNVTSQNPLLLRRVEANRARYHGSAADSQQEDRYDSMHIRRGDFQFTHMIPDTLDIYEHNAKLYIGKNHTVYIATDEANRTDFSFLEQHYNVRYLSDYESLLDGLNTNYFGMVDQLVAAQGETFMGTYFSTYTAYIIRLRGYYAIKRRYPGYEYGITQSYYLAKPQARFYSRLPRSYRSPRPPYWQEEFPVGWRDIDHDINL